MEVYILLGLLACLLFVWFILLSSGERRVLISYFRNHGIPDNPAPAHPNCRCTIEPPPSHQGLDHVPAEPRPQYQLLRKGEKILSKGARS